jgi:hypothetical protein
VGEESDAVDLTVVACRTRGSTSIVPWSRIEESMTRSDQPDDLIAVRTYRYRHEAEVGRSTLTSDSVDALINAMTWETFSRCWEPQTAVSNCW